MSNLFVQTTEIPNGVFNPVFQDRITPRTKLGEGITMAKFLGSHGDPVTMNLVLTSADKLTLAKQYYLHAQALQMINSSESTKTFENFRLEVRALKKLKGQGIGPEIVYVDYKKHFYVIERMDKELYKMWKSKELTQVHILQLLALCDRYIRSPFFHEDLHLNNVMWSERLNDFRIIDWGITLFIGDSLNSETTNNRKLNDLFFGSLMWAIMIYTLYNINKGGPDKQKWIAIQEKISNYIATNFPEKVTKYDIFSPEYKRKSYVKRELKALDNKSLLGSKKSRSKSNKHFYLK